MVVRVHVSQLAKLIWAEDKRHKSNGNVRKAEILYDKVFKDGAILEKANQGFRLISLCEKYCFNIRDCEIENCTTYKI